MRGAELVVSCVVLTVRCQDVRQRGLRTSLSCMQDCHLACGLLPLTRYYQETHADFRLLGTVMGHMDP